MRERESLFEHRAGGAAGAVDDDHLGGIVVLQLVAEDRPKRERHRDQHQREPEALQLDHLAELSARDEKDIADHRAISPPNSAPTSGAEPTRWTNTSCNVARRSS